LNFFLAASIFWRVSGSLASCLALVVALSASSLPFWEFARSVSYFILAMPGS